MISSEKVIKQHSPILPDIRKQKTQEPSSVLVRRITGRDEDILGEINDLQSFLNSVELETEDEVLFRSCHCLKELKDNEYVTPVIVNSETCSQHVRVKGSEPMKNVNVLDEIIDKNHLFSSIISESEPSEVIDEPMKDVSVV